MVFRARPADGARPDCQPARPLCHARAGRSSRRQAAKHDPVETVFVAPEVCSSGRSRASSAMALALRGRVTQRHRRFGSCPAGHHHCRLRHPESIRKSSDFHPLLARARPPSAPGSSRCGRRHFHRRRADPAGRDLPSGLPVDRPPRCSGIGALLSPCGAKMVYSIATSAFNLRRARGSTQ